MKKPAETPSEPEDGPVLEAGPETGPDADAVVVDVPASAEEPETDDSIRQDPTTQTSALIPAAPPPSVQVLTAVAPAPAPQPPAAPRTDWGRIARSILRTILLLLLSVILGGLLGLGVFLGIPWLYNRYVLPVQQHEQRLDLLEAQYSQQVGALQTGSDDQQERIDALENQLEDLVDDFDAYQSDQTASQERLAQDMAALQASLTEMETRLDTEIAGMDQSLQGQQDLVATLQAANLAQAESLLELRRQLTLLQAMELLSRARLFLTQNNLGLAQLEVEAARDHLAALRPDLSGNRAQVLDNILYRLGLALQNLQTAPVLVVDDLEVAWQMLRRGLDAPALPLFATPTPIALTSVLTETQVLTPTLTLTPATPYPLP